MILAFKFVPGEPGPDQWIQAGPLPDEKAIGPLPDGEYAVFEPSKGTIDDDREVLEQLPKTFTFKHRITNYTPDAPEAKIKVLK